MNINFAGGTIVLVSSAHNPAIITPQWIHDNLSISEKPIQHITSPAFSGFESKSFSIFGDPDRIQFISKNMKKEGLKALKDVVIRFINVMGHIPYTALGLNFRWHVEPKENEKITQIELTFDKENKTEFLRKEHDLRFGGTIYATKDPYVLRANIDPKGDILIYNFNFHFDINKVKIETFVKCIENYLDLYKLSFDIVDQTI